MKKLIVLLIVLAAIGVSVGAYYRSRRPPEPTINTMPVTRGDVAEVVAATGTLQAVETVDVGTQVSGTVQELFADFNSIVKKGQVIAKLDPSLIQTQIEQQVANVTRSEADLERLRVQLADAKQKYARAQELSTRNLIPRTELETAEVNVKSAEAQIRSSEAALIQAKAGLNNQKVNLQHTIIAAPIDGIVISRNVDVGQTVAASMSAPTLYILAADLTKMQVLANIDEADVGRMRPGQNVTFRVDAFPNETFIGNVEQVRLQPTVVQNVVTYSTVIAVPNNELKLKPGMTANVTIEVARKSNVLRIPAAALRFRPTEEMFQVLNQEMPTELQRGRAGFGNAGNRGNGGGRTAQGSGAAPGAAPSSGQNAAPAQGTNNAASAGQGGSTSAPGAGSKAARPQQQSGSATAPQGGGQPGSSGARGSDDRSQGGGRGFDPNMSPEERQRRMQERMANMTPEERERFMERMRSRQNNAQAPGGQAQGGATGGGRGGVPAQGNSSNAGGATTRRDASRGVASSIRGGAMHDSGKTTIDELFAPLPPVENRGRAWILIDKKLKPVNLRTGISDGTFTELLNGELQEGQEVVINMITGLEPKTTPGQGGQSNNPLMGPQRGGRGGGPGGFGGGGGGRGR